MAKQQKEEDYSGFVIALLIAFFIVLYLLSLGKFNGTKFRSRYDELKENLEKAKTRHQKLQTLIDRKQELKQKLEKRFKRIYMGVRVLLVAIWGCILFLFYAFGLLNNLGDVLNYSEAFILIMVTLNFLTFGTLTNLNHFLDGIKLRLQNWVYGKYVSIEGIIEVDHVKLQESNKTIDAIVQEIEVVKALPSNTN